MEVSNLVTEDDSESRLNDRRRHILRDIEPYVCLFDGCENSTECFATVDDWINHMQWQHAVVWCCQVSGHESSVYHSEEEFKHHLWQDHGNAFNESQLFMIVKKGAQPVSDIFGSLDLMLNGNEDGPQAAGACPLCPFSLDIPEQESAPDMLEVTKTSNTASRKLCDHIAAHMEAIALLSLPERDDLDDADTNERESEDTYHGLDQDAVDLPPVTSIIDNVDDDVNVYRLQHILESESSEYISRDDWSYILEDERVKSGQDIEPAQDPTLQEFVRRARRADMLRRWKIDRIPPIVIYDPDGLEIRPVFRPLQWLTSSTTDDIPSITVSPEMDYEDPDLITSERPSITDVDSVLNGEQGEESVNIQQAPSIVLHTPSGYSVTTEVPDLTNEVIMNEADRAYREYITAARKIIEEQQPSQHSVVDKWNYDDVNDFIGQ